MYNDSDLYAFRLWIVTKKPHAGKHHSGEMRPEADMLQRSKCISEKALSSHGNPSGGDGAYRMHRIVFLMCHHRGIGIKRQDNCKNVRF